MSFKNRTVWITGASSGIGEGLAYALHERGARLILSSRRREALERVKANCKGDSGNIRVIPLDLSETERMAEKVEEANRTFGQPVDYLFNNGAVSQRSLIRNTEMHVVRKIMEVNFFGTVALTKAMLPTMMERKGGHIVVISSILGKFSGRLRAVYSASKHALHGWFDCLRQEVHGQNIRVTLVCPGFIRTNISVNAFEGDGSRYGQMGPGQQNGMEPAVFADKLLPKVLRGKEEVNIGGREVMGVYLKRFVPGLFNKMLTRWEVL